MKTVNLISLISIYKLNGTATLNKYIQSYIGNDYNIEIKNDELDPLIDLLNSLRSFDNSLTIKYFSSFYIGYKIPQIGKEFDLIRISQNCVLNIEYKREISDFEKVKNQSVKNHYYLKFLKNNVYSYTYIQSENKIYTLDTNNNFNSVEFSELINIIKFQVDSEEYIFEDDLNNLFEPSKYLVSPFNKTSDFMNDNYFLTQEQDKTEKSINDKLKNNKYFLIEGNAGSGKTLLIYHIAKQLIQQKYNVCIIHCGKLNDGHYELQKYKGWKIKQVKEWKSFFYSVQYPDIIIIDEIQRIRKHQFTELIVNYINNYSTKLIMCGDEKQILDNSEGKYKQVLAENNIIPIHYELTSKIRTNKDIANFIKVMLDYGKKNTLVVPNKSVNITYFNTIQEANEYIANKKDYQYISYTPSQFYSNPYTDLALKNTQQIGNAHEVIGQEFKNVIVVMNNSFYYKGNILQATEMNGVPYITFKMFFQQITRAICNLEIVVVNNINIYNKLIEIFN